METLVDDPTTDVEVHLDRDVCAWILAHPERIGTNWILHVPTRATMEASARLDPDWAAFFAALPPGVRAQNAPACLTPGARLVRPLRLVDAGLFHDDGRLAIDPFVDAYVAGRYRAKSLRCRTCTADKVCGGAHVQSVRAHGFRQLRPLAGPDGERLAAEAAAIADPLPRLADAAPPRAPAPRLPVPGASPVPWIDTAPGRRS